MSATVCSYKVIHCSSYGQDNRPDELVKSNEELLQNPDNLSNHAMTNPHIQGWLTTPRCSYPQEVVLCLSKGLTLVDRLDILAHHSKIPSRIDIYLGITQELVLRKLVQFNRLGFISLGDNKSSDYCVRELKSVNIGYNAEYIRLVLWDCHKNMLNQNQQVGLAAIRVIGRKSEAHGDRNISRATANSISTVHSDDTDLDITRSKVDEQLSIWIDVLAEQKKLCVKAEDYQGARLYKLWSRNLLDLAGEIEELELEKLRAVEIEDFDEAERLKVVIREKRMDAQAQMAKDGIQIAEDGTILLDRYDHPMEKRSDSSVSVDISSMGDHVSETEPRSSTTSSNSLTSFDNPPSSAQTFIPALRNSKILRKSSSRSLKSSSSMTTTSRKIDNGLSSAIPPPAPVSNNKTSNVASDAHSQPLISFTPSPGEKSPEPRLNTSSIPKPSLIPTNPEDTAANGRINAKSVNAIKSIPTRIPSPRDKIIHAADDNDATKEAVSNIQAAQEPEKEVTPPRRGTVAKLERQLAELRLMAASSGQTQPRSNNESSIPKSTSMIKKSSVETLKSAVPATHVESGNSTAPVASEKKTTAAPKQAKKKNGLTRTSSYAKSTERASKSQNKVNSHSRDGERHTTRNSESSRKKSEEKKKSSTCIFCEEQNDSFNEDTLVSHYWNDCPVLTSCPLCQIILEISTLSEHIVTDCEQKHRIKRCPRCKEVIPIDKWLQHSLRQNCTVVSASETRCPLCREVIMPPTEFAWKRHLLQEGGCPHNPRRRANTIIVNR